jgi:hypothetical protein
VGDWGEWPCDKRAEKGMLANAFVGKLLMASAGALVSACGGDPVVVTTVPAGDWATLESASLSYHARPNDPLLCDGYVGELERYVAAVRGAFGNTRFAERVTVYQLSSQATSTPTPAAIRGDG